MIWFTSDTHFGHARIIELSGRPFKDVSHMNEMLVHNWNSVVVPDDRVFHLGDVALGPIMDSLKYISRLNGEIVLLDGNHDRRFMAKNDEQRAKWEQIYLDAGFARIHPNLALYNFDGLPTLNLSHFPYEGDSHDGDRFESKRLDDNGIPLLHGHTHEPGVVTWTRKRKKKVPILDDGGKQVVLNGKPQFDLVENPTIQIHVGVDAWNFTPVPATTIAKILVEYGLQAA